MVGIVLLVTVLIWACTGPMTVPDNPPVAKAIIWGPILAWAVPALVSVAGQIWSANKQSSANKTATAAQTQANQSAIDFEREKERRRQEEWEKTESDNERRWAEEIAREQRNADRAFGEDQFRDRRKDPYRRAGEAALADLTARNASSMKDLVGLGRI